MPPARGPRTRPPSPHPDPDRERVTELERAVRSDPGAFADPSQLTRRAGVRVAELAALLREHRHRTPAEVLDEARARAAARRLVESDARPRDVALDLGFDDRAGFEAVFRRRMHLAPAAYRRMRATGAFALDLPPDFRVDDALRFLGRDGASPTERVTGRRAERALRLDGRPAVLSLVLGDRRARCRVDAPRPPSPRAMARAHRAALRLLGLRTDPGPFERRVRRLPGGSRLIRGRQGLRVSLTPSAYEALLWSIVGQQVNLAFAFEQRSAVLDACRTRTRGGLALHPEPREVARLDYADLTRRRFSRRKAEYLIDVSRCIAAGELDLERLASAPAGAAHERLVAVRGIGPWSAGYVMMRGLGFADCVPLGDAGLVSSLRTFFELDERPGPEETARLMEPFAPHRSLACFHFWRRSGDSA